MALTVHQAAICVSDRKSHSGCWESLAWGQEKENKCDHSPLSFQKAWSWRRYINFPDCPWISHLTTSIHIHFHRKRWRKKHLKMHVKMVSRGGGVAWHYGIVPGLFLHRLTKVRGSLAIEPVRQMLQLLMFPMLTLNLISHYMISRPQRMWNCSSCPT